MLEAPKLNDGVRLSQDPISGEPVLLYPEGFIILNDTAHEIVRRCDGQSTVDQIVASLQEEFEVDAEQLKREATDCLRELHDKLLITFISL